MAISIRGTATAWTAATATTQTRTLPTHAAGDMLIVRVVAKGPATLTNNLVICNTTGWNPVGAMVFGGTTASSNGGGSVWARAFYKITTSAAETSPVLTYQNPSGTNVAMLPSAACAVAYQKAADETWETPVGNGAAVAAATAISASIGSVSSVSGDLIDAFVGTNDNTTLTVPTFTQSGMTFDTVAETPATALSSATSNDISADGCYRLATAGTSSGNIVITGTNSVADEGVGWATRLRVITPTPKTGTLETGTGTDGGASVAKAVYWGAYSAIYSNAASEAGTPKTGTLETATGTDASSAPTVALTAAAESGAGTDAVIDTYRSVVLSDSPVFLMPMGESSGNLTDIVASKTAVVSGTPTYGAAVPVAGSTAIDIPSGSDYFTVADHADLDLAGTDFTIEIWYARDTDSGAWQGIVSKQNAWGVSIDPDDYFAFTVPGIVAPFKISSGYVYPADGSWHHYVITQKAGASVPADRTGYVDGAAATLTHYSYPTIAATATDLVIGNDTGTYPAGGKIAYLAVYKSILSADRVAAHYASAAYGARASITGSESGIGTESASVDQGTTLKDGALETGTGTESASLVYLATGTAESGTGTDASTAPDASIAGAESGTGTDVGSVTWAIAGAESGTGTETATVTAEIATTAESGAGTETASKTTAITWGDWSAIYSNAVSVEKTGSESGTGADNASVTYAPSVSESGAGYETTLTLDRGGMDETGTATDTASALAVQVAGAESGTGTETASVDQGAILKSGDESGTGTDAVSAPDVQVSASDSGTGADAASAAITALDKTGDESGAGTEFAASPDVQVTASDSGTGAETATAGIAALDKTGDESGAGSESASVEAAVAVSDLGTASDASTAIDAALALDDSGAGGDAGSIVAEIAAAETGTGTDAASVLMVDIVKYVSDSGTATESASVTVAHDTAESGVGTELLDLMAVFEARADSGLGIDAGIGVRSLLLSDAGEGFDLSITVDLIAETEDERRARLLGEEYARQMFGMGRRYRQRDHKVL